MTLLITIVLAIIIDVCISIITDSAHIEISTKEKELSKLFEKIQSKKDHKKYLLSIAILAFLGITNIYGVIYHYKKLSELGLILYYTFAFLMWLACRTSCLILIYDLIEKKTILKKEKKYTIKTIALLIATYILGYIVMKILIHQFI